MKEKHKNSKIAIKHVIRSYSDRIRVRVRVREQRLNRHRSDKEQPPIANTL